MNAIVRSLFVSVLVLGAFAGEALAQDDDDEARHHFRLGQAHYESGHFVEAAEEFEASYRLSGRATLLHNIYVAYRDAGDVARAADALRRYLDAASEGLLENETVLRQRLATLERMVAEGRTRATAEEQEITEDAPPREQAPSTPPPSGGGGPSPAGFAVLGIGAAALIAGAITGGVALSVHDELASTCDAERTCPPGYDFQSRASTGDALAITTDVLIPVGVVAVAAGVVMVFVLTEGGEQPVTAGAACGTDGCMGFARGTF